MKIHFNDHNNDSWYKIEFCKIFRNPRIFRRCKKVYKTECTVVLHYADGDWDEFDI